MVAEVTRSRICLSLVAAVFGPGCFLSDSSHTQTFKPNWSLHGYGALLTVAILHYTWRIDLNPNGDSIKRATVFASLYWIAALVDYFLPGSLTIDPEFGTDFPQLPLFLGMLGLSWTSGSNQ